ncbi:MAG TPA: zinc-binding dehydrogenase, partial [Bacteroidales bacterium]|nr:zinc-binding dehydrogenase [Bacteroidales bacterium]
VRQYPMVPGIDFSGTVMETNSKEFKVGDRVFLTGRGYGTDRPGGFQEYADVRDKDLFLVPEGLSLRDVMLYGTAGFTAALSVDALLKERDVSGKDILVTGGAGGVSSHAVMILNRLGAHVTVATRNLDSTDYLKDLGAEKVILFDSLLEKRKALSREKWDGVIDATGGEALGNLLTEIKYGGVLAASGNLSGIKFSATVFPFILRGITLKGIESVYAENDKKIFSSVSCLMNGKRKIS